MTWRELLGQIAVSVASVGTILAGIRWFAKEKVDGYVEGRVLAAVVRAPRDLCKAMEDLMRPQFDDLRDSTDRAARASADALAGRYSDVIGKLERNVERQQACIDEMQKIVFTMQGADGERRNRRRDD